MRQFLRILVGILRELGDENAYARHLAMGGLADSAAEWRRFSDARMKKKYSNAKCC
ncbi:MAG: hypothetical protein H7Y20_08960 [Bryobacteraceae bacterium]|nr:hypothetical protein [Bryobacteraceae bacterium]